MLLASRFCAPIVSEYGRAWVELSVCSLCIVVIDGWGKEEPVAKRLLQLWNDDRGQDIAEYAVMLAVILVIVVGTVRLIGSNANNVFSQVGSAIQ